MPEVTASLNKLDVESAPMPAAELAAFCRKVAKEHADVTREFNITVDMASNMRIGFESVAPSTIRHASKAASISRSSPSTKNEACDGVWLSSSLRRARKRPPGLRYDRRVHHLAIQLHCGSTRCDVGSHHSLRPIDLLRAWRHCLVHNGDLTGVNAQLAAEPKPQRAAGVVPQPRVVPDLQGHAVDGWCEAMHARSHGNGEAEWC